VSTFPRSLLGLSITILAACGGGTPSSSSLAFTAPPSSASPSPSGPAELPTYHEGLPRSIKPGTYLTAIDGFFPGLSLTIPAGWQATETDTGEIALHPANRPDDAILLWKDIAAVVTNNRSGTVGEVLDNVGRTADALLDWLTTTKDFAILAKPTGVTVGDSIKGTQLTLGVSNTANFAWDDCPDNPRCAAIFTDPRHWGSNFYAIGGDEVARVFIATVHYPDGDHTFLVTLDAPNENELVTLAADAEPIIQSLRLPARYTDN
jgi:hypothetical protein